MKATPIAPFPEVGKEKCQRLQEDIDLINNLASHGLKSPLNTILIYCSELEERLSSHALLEEEKWLHVIRHETERMREMIIALFDYLSIEINSNKPLTPVNSEETLQIALDNLQPMIKEAQAVITHDPLPVIMGRQKYIVSLFRHLIENALLFKSEQTPIIHISATPKGAVWEFNIKDNGIGIAEEFHEVIFILFQRLNPVDKYSGLGVGLALCKKIVECSGGKIYVESEPEKGSTFFFTLPAQRTI